MLVAERICVIVSALWQRSSQCLQLESRAEAHVDSIILFDGRFRALNVSELCPALRDSGTAQVRG